MMKLLSWLLLFFIFVFILAGCTSTSPTVPPAITDTKIPVPTVTVRLPIALASPTATITPLYTLDPEKVRETMQPLLREPMNCDTPCFWGIVPGKTHLDEARIFFSRLGFTPFEGKDFYTISYSPDTGGGFVVTLYTTGDIVKNIVITPEIAKPKEGSSREWIAYSPETLIKRYGNPSRVEFGLDWGPNFVIIMIMYFDTSDLIVEYSGYNMIPGRPQSPRLCPLTAPFDYVRLWMGQDPPDVPSFKTVSLVKATTLTMELFTQLMLGNPQEACFTINGDVLQ